VLARIPGDTSACGGPDYADLGPVAPLDTALDFALKIDVDGMASWGSQIGPELRFLYPFWKARSNELDPLWNFAYHNVSELPAPPSTVMEAAVRSGNAADAEREARAVIDGIYRMPPVPAAHHRALLERAVEIVELAPRPAPTVQPSSAQAHAASTEYRTLQEHLRSRIPDGWADAVRKNVAPPVFVDLLREADAWLTRYPRHPLADMVRLSKIRVRYFQGDLEAAWDLALGLLPTRPIRALAEMRYLMLQGTAPSGAAQSRIQDFELVTALVTQDSLDAARFQTLWGRARSAKTGSTRTNLEERLLAWAARNASPGHLPGSFPAQAEVATPLWGKLRAIALLKAEQWDRAREQLALVPPDAERTRLMGHLLVRTGHPEAAAALPGVDPRARQYLVGALLSDADVERLASSSDKAIRATATFEGAVRRAHQNQWADAIAAVARSRPDRAVLFRRARDISTSQAPERDLTWAHFLDEHDGRLFSDVDPGFYRAVSDYEEKLPAGTRERVQIRDMFMRSTERWLAIESYTRWLVAHPRAPNAREVLEEADRAYGKLTNFGGADTFFWGRTGRSTSVIADLLRVGAEIRRREQ
jgi:hypothetical protein